MEYLAVIISSTVKEIRSFKPLFARVHFRLKGLRFLPFTWRKNIRSSDWYLIVISQSCDNFWNQASRGKSSRLKIERISAIWRWNYWNWSSFTILPLAGEPFLQNLIWMKGFSYEKSRRWKVDIAVTLPFQNMILNWFRLRPSRTFFFYFYDDYLEMIR